MSEPARIVVSGAVEGDIDEMVLRRLVTAEGAVLGSVYGRQGKDRLLQRLPSYNHAARLGPWIVIVDLDRSPECAPLLRQSCLPACAPGMCFRVAVRTIEAWLLADREAVARFLDVSVSRLPLSPDADLDPKRILLALAAGSRRSEIRKDMAPRPGSGRQIGPAYSSRLIELVRDFWRPEIAAKRSDSLRRCRSRLRELITTVARSSP